jgi:hypothetical protein
VGFVKTAIKGKIDTTPIISNNAIIVIIINKKDACIRSSGVSKYKNFFKVSIYTLS